LKFNELRSGSQIFIDANIFIYHFSGTSEECSQLLKRCEDGEIAGFTTAHTLLEVMHRMMMLEAVSKKIVAPGNIAKKLKERPELIKNLNDYPSLALKIPAMQINILPITQELCYDAIYFQKKYGIMTNDSLLLASAKSNRCFNIASNDLDFFQIQQFNIYKPDDIVL
jgi:predicted nucleic acid-binding protein